jgi:hypothetical protein
VGEPVTKVRHVLTKYLLREGGGWWVHRTIFFSFSSEDFDNKEGHSSPLLCSPLLDWFCIFSISLMLMKQEDHHQGKQFHVIEGKQTAPKSYALLHQSPYSELVILSACPDGTSGFGVA